MKHGRSLPLSAGQDPALSICFIVGDRPLSVEPRTIVTSTWLQLHSVKMNVAKITCLEQNVPFRYYTAPLNFTSNSKLQFNSVTNLLHLFFFFKYLFGVFISHGTWKKKENGFWLNIYVSRKGGLAVCHAFLRPSAWSLLHLLSIASLLRSLAICLTALGTFAWPNAFAPFSVIHFARGA